MSKVIDELEVLRHIIDKDAIVSTFKGNILKGDFTVEKTEDGKINIVKKDNGENLSIKDILYVAKYDPDEFVRAVAKEDIHQEYRETPHYFFLGRMFKRSVVVATYTKGMLKGQFACEFPYSILLKDGELYQLVMKHAIKVIALEQTCSVLMREHIQRTRELVKHWIRRSIWANKEKTKRLRFQLLKRFPIIVNLREGETFAGVLAALTPHWIGMKAYKYKDKNKPDRETYIIMRHAISGLKVKKRVPPKKTKKQEK